MPLPIVLLFHMNKQLHFSPEKIQTFFNEDIPTIFLVYGSAINNSYLFLNQDAATLEQQRVLKNSNECNLEKPYSFDCFKS